MNSVQIFSHFDADEPRKIRIGTKYQFVSESDPGLRVALFGSAADSDLPLEPSTRDQVVADLDTHQHAPDGLRMGNRADQGHLHRGRLPTSSPAATTRTSGSPTGSGSERSGRPDRSLPPPDRASSTGRSLDGGDYPEENYSMLTTGVRFFFGRSGFAVSAALNCQRGHALQARLLALADRRDRGR